MSRRPGRATRTIIGITAACLLPGLPGAGSVEFAGPSPARAQVPAEPLAFPTPAERADYGSYTGARQVVPYLDRLSREFEGVEIGTLPGSRIPVARIASTGTEPPLRVLVLAAQHGTERAGLEVALRLVRDVVAGRLERLRSGLELRIVPMANPDGVENRRRLSAEGIDLHLDHIRLEAIETRAIWAEYAAWRPHLVLDLHELGPSEYPLQIGVPTHPNAPGARRLARYYLMPYVANELARADVPFHEYVAPWVDGETAERAARPTRGPGADRDDVWFTPPPLDPATARNAFALAGSASFYIATSSSRDIIGLRERTERLHLAVSALLTAAVAQAPVVRATVEAAERMPKDSLVLRARYVEARPGAGLPWIFINERGQREQDYLRPWRSRVAVERRLSTPAGWWVEPDRVALIAALRDHGFLVGSAHPAGDGVARAMAYPDCPDAGDPVESEVPADALWVPADQAGGRLLFTLIEPASRGGWFASDGGFGRPESDGCGPGGRFPVYRRAR